MKHEKSCVIVVFYKDKVLLVHHNAGHWGMPKGHVEENETDEETAKREVYEETGVISTIIDGFKEKITYSPKEGVEKDVYFFVGESNSLETKNQEIEVSEAIFINIDDALDLIPHNDTKKVLEKAINFYKNLKNI